jgi:hypothetical protein
MLEQRKSPVTIKLLASYADFDQAVVGRIDLLSQRRERGYSDN